MTTATRPNRPTPPSPRPAMTPPPLQRPVFTRLLSWRNPWTMLLAALAAFQAGVITTLLWTSGRSNLGVAELPSLPAPPAIAPAPLPAPAAVPAPAPTPPVAAPSVAAPVVAPPAPLTPPTRDRDRDRPGAPRRHGAGASDAPAAPAAPAPAPAVDGAADAPDALIEVEIDSEPQGATVRIAGAVWGVTPLTAYLPGRGPVTIHLELDGHASTRLVWTPSGKRSLSAVLSPLETP